MIVNQRQSNCNFGVSRSKMSKIHLSVSAAPLFHLCNALWENSVNQPPPHLCCFLSRILMELKSGLSLGSSLQQRCIRTPSSSL